METVLVVFEHDGRWGYGKSRVDESGEMRTSPSWIDDFPTRDEAEDSARAAADSLSLRVVAYDY